MNVITKEASQQSSGRVISYLLLHCILVLYSIGGLIAKKTAGHAFLSLPWIANYSVIIAILFAYAIAWQMILKRINLTVAFCNKAVTIVWGIIWGAIFFSEAITIKKVLGAAVVMIGVWMVILGDKADA